MMEYKHCKDCGKYLPVNRENFGQYKNVRADGTIRIAYRNSCRKCMAANTAKYDRENPDNARIRRERREQNSSVSGGNYTSAQIQSLRIKLNDQCRFCGKSLNGKGEIEHLTPVSRGGSSNINNLTLSCDKCNKEKTNKTLDEYIEWRKERNLFVRKIRYRECPDMQTIEGGRKSYR